jgi:hypothetical protein
LKKREICKKPLLSQFKHVQENSNFFAKNFHSLHANSASNFVIRLSGGPYRFKIFMGHLNRAVEKETDVSAYVVVEASSKKQHSNMQQNYCHNERL